MATAQATKAPVKTEDLGKIFEKGICMLYNTDYKGKYKYSLEEAAKYKERCKSLVDLFPSCSHTAIRGGQYDFTAVADENKHLSAKTTKGDGKVCPQVIGQPSKKNFSKYFGIEGTPSNDEIKAYIQANLGKLLAAYNECTFDCPILYYNKASDAMLYITQTSPIAWDDYTYDFSHKKNKKEWNESSSLYVTKDGAEVCIGEFQVHAHRDGIKFRWNFEKLLALFADNFRVEKF